MTDQEYREEEMWDRLVRKYRDACILHQEGHKGEAQWIMAKELPGAISDWSRATRMTGELKKQKLRNMMLREREKIGDLAILQDMVIRRVSERIIPMLEQLIVRGMHHTGENLHGRIRGIATPHDRAGDIDHQGHPLHRDRPLSVGTRKIPISDVAGMIDALYAEEYGQSVREMIPLHMLAQTA